MTSSNTLPNLCPLCERPTRRISAMSLGYATNSKELAFTTCGYCNVTAPNATWSKLRRSPSPAATTTGEVAGALEVFAKLGDVYVESEPDSTVIAHPQRMHGDVIREVKLTIGHCRAARKALASAARGSALQDKQSQQQE